MDLFNKPFTRTPKDINKYNQYIEKVKILAMQEPRPTNQTSAVNKWKREHKATASTA